MSKSFVMHDMLLDGLRNTQNLQVMQHRSAGFPGEGLGAYHYGGFRHRIPRCIILTFTSIMWDFLGILCI